MTNPLFPWNHDVVFDDKFDQFLDFVKVCVSRNIVYIKPPLNTILRGPTFTHAYLDEEKRDERVIDNPDEKHGESHY